MKRLKHRALAVACSMGILGAQAQDQPPVPPAPPLDATFRQDPLHQEAADSAWSAFQAGRFEVAISNADRCITRFREAADRSHAALVAKGTTLPLGEVSEAEKQAIAQYQILHDVAACLLVKGWAAEKLGRVAEAKAALQQAKKYPLARRLSPESGVVWSPADKAAEKLAQLEKTRN